MNIKTFLLGFVCVFILLFGTGSSALADDPPASQPQSQEQSQDQTQAQKSNISVKDVKRFGTAIQIIKSYYVEKTADDKLFEGAIRGMLGQLDPHSDFLNADDLKDLRDVTTGQFSGLGIEITVEEGLIKVVSPLDGSPAQKAGVKPGDLIALIDNVPVKDLTLREAVKKMRGKKGTAVTLTVIRKNEAKPLKLKLVRDDIKVPSVKGRLLEEGYGYVRISSFQTGTAKSLEQTVADLKKQSHGKLKGLILDLRNNPGGLLDSATAVSDDFLEPSAGDNANNLIVYTKGRLPGSELKVNATPGDIINGAPMVVLINEGSASGSEIVAGALQDHKRALILGVKSFGKGSVQTVIPIDSDSAIKLTTALYYTPNGRSIQAEGIKPDVVVNDLKIAAPDEKEQKLARVKEADLNRHLENANKEVTPKEKELAPAEPAPAASDQKKEELPTVAELPSSDYQLYEAFNILKALVVEQQQQSKS